MGFAAALAADTVRSELMPHRRRVGDMTGEPRRPRGALADHVGHVVVDLGR